MTWSFNIDNAPIFTDLFIATKDDCVTVDWKRANGRWAQTRNDMVIAWQYIQKPQHPHSTQVNP